MTRVVLHSPHPIVRAGLENLITTSSIEVVGSSSTVAALRQLLQQQPDVLLLEEPEDELLGERLCLDYKTPAVIVLSDQIANERVADALSMGVQALLPLSATAAEIMTAVEAVAQGLTVLHPYFTEELFPPSPPALVPDTAPLTTREVEVLQMLALGLGNKEIAARLTISEHTVKFHVSSLFAKLNASSRTEAVTLGLRQGLILL
ncbi:MAG: response regulator transcription factor [Cyanophyceae cyanobacterium]